MLSLRDLWRRSWLHQYFALMEPIDRATALIALLLAAAIAIAFAAVVGSREDADSALSPATTAPPFELRFAGVAR